MMQKKITRTEITEEFTFDLEDIEHLLRKAAGVDKSFVVDFQFGYDNYSDLQITGATLTRSLASEKVE